jgi:hypothetical protein
VHRGPTICLVAQEKFYQNFAENINRVKARVYYRENINTLDDQRGRLIQQSI